MWLDTGLACIHYLSAFAIVAGLTVEATLLRGEPDRTAVDILSRADLVFFLAATLVVLSGGARWGISPKGLLFHAGNQLFWLKLLLVFVMGLLSMWPAMRYGRWRALAHMDAAYRVPTAEAHLVRRVLFVQLTLLGIIPIVASMMSRGIGT